MAIEINKNVNLSQWTSWGVGGSAEFYCAPENIEELKEAMLWARKNSKAIGLLGGGTNILVSDQGVEGLTIHTHRMNKVSIIESTERFLVEAETGAPKAEVLKLFMKQRLAPAVFLAGLPGDMGGGVVMNAGVGHKVAPREFVEIVDGFDVLELNSDGEFIEKSFKKDDVHWVYRHSSGWQPGIITKVRVSWPNQPDDEVLKRVRDGNKRRKDTQPLNMPSCGSVFKNPEGDHSGRLIEAAGLKGTLIGGAQVSEKHANFIVNTGNATAMDIHKLMQLVQQTVLEKFQINLTNEVVYFGKW